MGNKAIFLSMDIILIMEDKGMTGKANYLMVGIFAAFREQIPA
jgi:hypothetical protein